MLWALIFTPGMVRRHVGGTGGGATGLLRTAAMVGGYRMMRAAGRRRPGPPLVRRPGPELSPRGGASRVPGMIRPHPGVAGFHPQAEGPHRAAGGPAPLSPHAQRPRRPPPRQVPARRPRPEPAPTSPPPSARRPRRTPHPQAHPHARRPRRTPHPQTHPHPPRPPRPRRIGDPQAHADTHRSGRPRHPQADTDAGLTLQAGGRFARPAKRPRWWCARRPQTNPATGRSRRPGAPRPAPTVASPGRPRRPQTQTDTRRSRRPDKPQPTLGPRAMNPAFRHLEAKLRIGDLTIRQWLSILFGVMLPR